MVVLALAGATASDRSAAATMPGEELAVTLCSSCHGPRGVSTSPEFPILAAQQEEYIEAQLRAFRAKTRGEKDAHDFMWGVAGHMDDRAIEDIAAYYQAQPAAPGRAADPTLVAEGATLYAKGVQGRGIPACATCHGPNGEGTGAFPRLAGQHAKYLVKQLGFIQSLTRNAPVMHGIVEHLTEGEMYALAAYLQSK